MTHRSRRRLVSLPLAVLAAAAIASPALAGTDGDEEFEPTPTPAPFVQPVEAPPSVAPAPAVPAPEVPAPPAVPVDTALSQPGQAHKAKTERKSHKKAAKRETVSHRAKTVVASTQAKAVVTPSGGVQAGAGGTAIEPSDAPVGALLLGGLALVLVGGGARAFARN